MASGAGGKPRRGAGRGARRAEADGALWRYTGAVGKAWRIYVQEQGAQVPGCARELHARLLLALRDELLPHLGQGDEASRLRGFLARLAGATEPGGSPQGERGRANGAAACAAGPAPLTPPARPTTLRTSSPTKIAKAASSSTEPTRPATEKEGAEQPGSQRRPAGREPSGR